MNNFSYSVIIPYGKKTGNFLRCVESVLRQVIKADAIFVVCNGVITSLFIKEVISTNLFLLQSNIYFIYPENCFNANIARNIGLSHVKSEWVAYLDSDDWWEFNWSELFKLKIESDNCDFVYGSILINGVGNSKIKLISENYKNFGTPENYLLAYMPAQTSTFVVKLDLAIKVKWNEKLNRHQDYDFFVRLIAFNSNVSHIPLVGVNVDWSIQRRHKYHLNCLNVIKGWRSCVDKKYYLRHLKNLCKSSLISWDCFAFLFITLYLIQCKLYYNDYLIKDENIID